MEVRGSLSPSRAADFRSCALAYRFRTVDRLPETPSAAAARGTLVHRVLERLFDLPASERTPAVAVAMLPAAWTEMVEVEPVVATLFDDGRPDAQWLASCGEVVRRWFTLEDPRGFEPLMREELVEAVLDDGLLLRGVVDRIDEAADGTVTVVDYKTGSAPPPEREGGAMFQLRFYALLLWLTREQEPARLRLLYLGNGEVLEYRPDRSELQATRRLLMRIWEAIALARETGDFEPNPGPLCRWCDYQPLCPAFGGTPPPYPGPGTEQSGPQSGQVGDVEPDQAVAEDPLRRG
ncbi:RecB family exonuclease [Nocardioides mangrovicus]|uniref:RecB family exonuclease n=1 Tax=Nocardioides mangrovicus TaxID=2478913 RepID=UPI001E2CAE96|nr:PD-(D/E)XK nuclease family protein [Nocardioides mangrovicus]